MIQTLPVNINSFKHSLVAFIFPFPTKPFFLTSSCLLLFSSCKPFLGPASCPVKTCLLGWSFSPQHLVNLPSLAGYLSKIRCIQLRPRLTYRGRFLEWCRIHNGPGGWKVVIDGHSIKKGFFFFRKQEHVFTVLSLLVHLPLREERSGY